MSTIRFRPLVDWNRPRTAPGNRRHNPFSAPWSDTMSLLRSEIDKLGGSDIVIELDMDESQIRLDGLPRSGAKLRGDFPGVAISFTSKYGPLRYGSDSCTRWEQNIRAIALGLQSLRAVDRYGITVAGEQYTGFKAITAGPSDGLARRSPRDVIAHFAGCEQGSLSMRSWIRKAQVASHPDTGGSPEDFDLVSRAAKQVEQGSL